MINKLQNIIAGLKTIINKDFYIGVPQEIPNDIYITLNVISQITNVKVNNRTRVEFRIIGKNQTGLNELDLIEKQIFNYIVNNYQNLGFFKFEIGNYYNGYDELKRPVLIRDYIFYYVIK